MIDNVNYTLSIFISTTSFLCSVYHTRNCNSLKGSARYDFHEISEKCGFDVQQTKKALEKQKSTGLITIDATLKFSIITLFGYDGDLFGNKKSNSQITDNQHAEQQSNNSPTLLIKENKNIRNQEYALAREGGGCIKTAINCNIMKFRKNFPNAIDNREIILYNEKVRHLTHNILYEGAGRKWQ